MVRVRLWILVLHNLQALGRLTSIKETSVRHGIENYFLHLSFKNHPEKPYPLA